MEIKTSEGKFTITEVDFLFYSPYKATAPSNLRVSTRVYNVKGGAILF